MKELLLSILKNLTSRFIDLSVNERVNDYRANFYQYQNMMAQVTMETDKALMTFSIAALNDAIFKSYGWLSFLTLTCFVMVVIIVIVGYSVSKALIKDAQRIMTNNFKTSLKTPLGEGLNKVKFAKLSKTLNFASSGLFIVGMTFFVVLMALYIKGV
jgi:ABC-type Co2+ transport system permease subunit